MKRKEYINCWKTLKPIEIKMIKKAGKCKHNFGDRFCYRNPYEKPKGLCNALIHVLDLYAWRVALGFPSWEKDAPKVYRIHCPSKNGTVWEMKLRVN